MLGSPQNIVHGVLENSSHFVIPVYQRRYSWGRQQVQRLVDDLFVAHQKQMQNYFLGSLIVDTSYGIHEQAVIDGQQRLTTISLFMMAIRELLPEGDARNKERIYRRYLTDEFDDSSIAQNRLHSVPGDEEEYVDVLLHGLDAAPSLFRENYEYLLQAIKNSVLSPNEWLDFLTEHVQVMLIQIQQGDDAQLIFESLNSTGLDLTEADKIRNYLLMSLPREEQAQAFSVWKNIELLVGTSGMSRFYRDYLTSLELSSKPTKEANVYDDYRLYVGGKSDFNRLTQLQIEASIAKDYAFIIRPRESDFTNRHTFELMRRLNHLHIDVINPFLLQVFSAYKANTTSIEELNGVLTVLLSYLARRLVVGIPTTGLNTTFSNLNRQIINYQQQIHAPYDVVMTYLLMKKVQPNKQFVSDDDLNTAIKTKDFYHFSSNSLWFVLDELNNVTGEYQNLFDSSVQRRYTIEHIMPQTLSAEWRKQLGEDANQIHELWLNRLSNLTLTGFNSQMSNKLFIEKRDMKDGYRDSALKLNQWLGRQEQWKVHTLQERENVLFELAKDAWPYPTIPEVEDPDQQEEWVILAPGEDYRGLKIDAFKVNDDQLEKTDNWKNMQEQIFERFWHQDPSKFYKVARLATTDLIVDADNDDGVSLDDYYHLSGSTLYVKSGYLNNNNRNVLIWKLLDLISDSNATISVRVSGRMNLKGNSQIYHRVDDAGAVELV